MQTTSAIYKSLLHNPLAEKEIKAVIAGATYGHDKIVSARVSGALFESFSIGNTASRELDIEIVPQGTIPRQAKIQLYLRIILRDDTGAVTQSSEWIPKGEFFFSTRSTDKATGWMTVTAFDAMLKSEEDWINESYSETNFPMAASAAVADIAQRMGVEVDSRTSLSTAFTVAYPIGDSGSKTMREVLAEIAVANAGNWIITDAGKLLLVPLNSIPAETNYLVTEYGYAITFGGTRILING